MAARCVRRRLTVSVLFVLCIVVGAAATINVSNVHTTTGGTWCNFTVPDGNGETVRHVAKAPSSGSIQSRITPLDEVIPISTLNASNGACVSENVFCEPWTYELASDAVVNSGSGKACAQSLTVQTCCSGGGGG